MVGKSAGFFNESKVWGDKLDHMLNDVNEF
jgi:hypothetical protein